MSTLPPPLRWGIISAGLISHDFCVALGTLPAEEHQIVAVAARQKVRAEAFAKKHNIPKAFDCYRELAAVCKEVDIVYIGALNPQHYMLSKIMLDYGKHVLCEKPLCMNRKQAQKLLEYAERKQLFLMEAVWSRFFPSYQYVRQQIEADALGEIREVEVTFGYPLSDIERVQKKNLGGGVIMDIGVYAIQFSQFVFREAPLKIEARGELNADGVDIEVKAELHYASGGVAKMHFSGKGPLDNKAVIKGTKGEITLMQFWCPTKIIDIDGSEKEWPLPEGKYPTNFPNCVGLRYEAQAARQCILEGKLQNNIVSHTESLIIAKIQEQIRRQLGVVYKEDNDD